MAHQTSTNSRAKSSRRAPSARRASSGSALIICVIVVSLFIIGALPVIIFFANASAQGVIQADSQHIARQTAQVLDDNRFWLDALRPGYDEENAVNVAKAAASSMCERSGMKLNKVELSVSTDEAGNHRTNCSLEVDARRRFPLLVSFGGFDMNTYFKGVVKATSFTEHSSTPPYSLIHMDAPTTGIDESHKRPLGFNQRDVAVIPAYGFFYTAVAGETKMPTPYGKGIAAGQWGPENFMAMNHYHFKKTDLEYVTVTGNDVINNSWHPQRVYNGKEIFVNR